MKYTIFLLILFLSVPNLNYGQVLELSISDSIGEPIFAAKIFINDSREATYNGEVLFLIVKNEDQLKVESYFHKDFYKEIILSEFSNDTFRLHVILSQKNRDLETVVITGEETKVFYDIENSNVIDYYPYQGLSLFIIKEQGKRFLQLNRDSKLLAKTETSFKANKIYLDGFGNFHAITPDSVYQIWFNEGELEWLKPTSINTFKTQIVPLVGKTSKGVFTEKYKSSNKYYSVDYMNHDSTFQCYLAYDGIAHKMARIQENKIIAMYYSSVPSYENIIEMGFWNGEIKKLAQNYELIQEIGWYESALDNPIRCEAFGMERFIAVVDIYTDSVAIIDYETNKVVKKSKLNNPCQGITTVFYDYFNDAVYLIDQTGNGVDIYILNPVNGIVRKMKGIYDIPFVENIKISGDWVYFEIRERTGFSKILRQRIL